MVTNHITIENARIAFRNFAGEAGQYNAAGRRNFCVFLEKELADTLTADGWNVRWLEPRDEGDDPQAYIQVAVQFGKIPPKIVLISSRGKTLLDEESIKLLDIAEIAEIDLIIRPYNWVLHEGTKKEISGVKAYLKSMYVTLAEDELEKKYYNLPTEGVSESIDGD